MNPPATTAASQRHARLDVIKAAVTLLVVFHHTAITYGAVGGWFYVERAPDNSLSSLLLLVFCTVNQAWFMGLFFLLAGRFTPAAIQRKGAAAYLRDRALRLGVPWLIFGLVLGPLTIAWARTARGDSMGATLTQLWQQGVFEPGPLWFSQALLVFALFSVWAARRAPEPGLQEPQTALQDQHPRNGPSTMRGATATASYHAYSLANTNTGVSPKATANANAGWSAPLPSSRALMLAALAVGVVAFVLRLAWPVGTTLWHLQLGYFASYVCLFVVGYRAANRGWFEHLQPAQVLLWRRVSWLVLPTLLPLAFLGQAFPVLQAPATGGWNLPSLMYAFWEPLVAWGVLLRLLAWAARPAPAVSPLWQLLARRAYGIFVIHPPVVVGVALSWRHVPAPALLKFLVTGMLSCLLCFWLVGLLLRVPAVRRVL